MNRLLKPIFKPVWDQIIGKDPQPQRQINNYVKSPNCCKRMIEHNISEQQIQEVFTKGSMIKNNMLSREYFGYSIGLLFEYHADAKIYQIVSCWRRKNWR